MKEKPTKKDNGLVETVEFKVDDVFLFEEETRKIPRHIEKIVNGPTKKVLFIKDRRGCSDWLDQHDFAGRKPFVIGKRIKKFFGMFNSYELL